MIELPNDLVKKYSYDETWTAMCIMEAFIEIYRDDVGDDRPLTKYWQNVGVSQIRDDIIRTVMPWVNEIWEILSKNGDTEVAALTGLDAFDWEFVPACLHYMYIEPTNYPNNINLPEPSRVAALLIAEHVLEVVP